jgi:hypothetical protein
LKRFKQGFMAKRVKPRLGRAPACQPIADKIETLGSGRQSG